MKAQNTVSLRCSAWCRAAWSKLRKSRRNQTSAVRKVGLSDGIVAGITWP
ncbi:DUF2690 domain-containing protein [Pseudoduganella ginsengisoli]